MTYRISALSRPGILVISVATASAWTCTGTATAAITTTGETSPLYNNADPWFVGADLIVGDVNLGTLDITAGSRVENNLGFVAYTPGSTGDVAVTGSNSQWINSDNALIGRYGDGSLLILDGGRVSDSNGYLGYWAGALGTATVNGVGSEWANTGAFHVGRFGQGVLTIEDGGRVTNDAIGYIASQPGSTGVATVTGTGSRWDGESELRIGNAGTGTLNILNGGEVFNVDGRVGFEAGSNGTVNVSGTDSRWLNVNPNPNLGGSVNLGVEGTGTLNISAGGEVRSSTSILGLQAGSSGTAAVSGTDSLWWNEGHFIVGQEGQGSLTIDSGGRVESLTGAVGNGPTIDNTATITGAGSRWDMTAGLNVGHSGGSGTLTIENGGVVRNSAALIGFGTSVGGINGTVIIDGLGSMLENYSTTNSLFQVGSGGGGRVQVQNKGIVTSVNAILGRYVTGNGKAVVEGAGSVWTNSGHITIGGEGRGEILISNGGVLQTGNAVLGQASIDTPNSGRVEVIGEDSRWDIHGGLFVGSTNGTTITIIDGGEVNVIGSSNLSQDSAAGEIQILSKGKLFLDSGSHVVTGAIRLYGESVPAAVSVIARGYETRIDMDRFQIGGAVGIGFGIVESSFNRVMIQNGAFINNTGVFSLNGTATVTGRDFLGGRSTLSVSNGLLIEQGVLNIENGGLVVTDQLSLFDHAVVNLLDGILSADIIEINDGGNIQFIGGTLISDSLVGNLVQDGGELAPGNSPGLTSISGDYTFNNGTLAIELGGVTPGTEYDRVEVSGFADLHGDLIITLIDEFVPSLGDSFAFLFAGGGYDASFGTISLPDLQDPDLDWRLNTGGASIILEVINTATPGDTDSDGDIDDSDLGTAFSNYTGPLTAGVGDKTFADGDTDGDGDVDDSDLGTAFSNYTGPTAVNIPEPTSGLMLLMLGSLAARRRRH